MNRKWISESISNIDDTYIAETLSPPAANQDHAPERMLQMSKYERRGRSSRRLFSLILAACLVFAMALTAYAANLFGIREMLRIHNQELPEAADPYIQHHTETAAAEDWSARITESLCDTGKILTTVTVSGGNKYIIVPTDAAADDSVGVIGMEGNQTLREYAAAQGKELLFVGASLVQNEHLGIFVESQTFVNLSATEMNILVESNRSGEESGDAICSVYARDEAANRLNLELPFTLKQAPSEVSNVYVPANADVIPGITVGEATVTETPLGISIRFPETVTDEGAFCDIMKVAFDGLEYGEGGSVLEDDGNWYFTVSGCTGEVGDKLIVRYYDWDSQLIGTIEFQKK